MRYSIEGQELTDIADALRRKHGETEWADIPVGKNPTIDETGNCDNLAVFYFPDATSVKVHINYCIGYGVNYIYFINGEYTDIDNYPTSDAHRFNYGSTRPQEDEVTFENTNIISARCNFTSGENGLFINATITGYDENGDQVEGYEKKEVTRTYQSNEMAQAIDDIPAGPPAEAFVISGNCRYKFSGGGWDWFVQQHGHKIQTKDVNNAMYMFSESNVTEIPFEINFTQGSSACASMFYYCKNLVSVPSIDFNHTAYVDCNSLFYGCEHVTDIGDVKNLYPSDISSLFCNCRRLRYIPNFINLNLSRIRTYAYGRCSSMFQSCFSLRSVPEDFLKQFYGIWTSGSYTVFSSCFSNCSSIDEIRGLNPQTGTITSNIFGSYSSGTFASCYRVKNIVFAKQDDGTPYKTSWKTQTIDLSANIGYVPTTAYESNVLNYNSGITRDKQVTDDATYQALKDDPDWWTIGEAYSRYNHDSAVATINSLPDTSAYIAANGGTNTIKFKGNSGSKTDGGAINTLTAEEIAVATAKGWTVTLS